MILYYKVDGRKDFQLQQVVEYSLDLNDHPCKSRSRGKL